MILFQVIEPDKNGCQSDVVAFKGERAVIVQTVLLLNQRIHISSDFAVYQPATEDQRFSEDWPVGADHVVILALIMI